MTTHESSGFEMSDDQGFELAGSIMRWLEQNEVEIRRNGRTLLLSPKDSVTEEMMEVVRSHAPDLVFRMAAQDWWMLWHSIPMETFTRKH